MLSGLMRKTCYAAAVCLIIFFAGVFAVQAAELKRLDEGIWTDSDNIIGLHIGPEVEEIADNTFINQIELKSIQVSEDNPNYSSFSNCLYNKDKTVLICMPQALRGMQLPETVTSLNWYALYGVDWRLANEIRDGIWKNCDREGIPYTYVKEGVYYRIESWPYTREYPYLYPKASDLTSKPKE